LETIWNPLRTGANLCGWTTKPISSSSSCSKNQKHRSLQRFRMKSAFKNGASPSSPSRERGDRHRRLHAQDEGAVSSREREEQARGESENLPLTTLKRTPGISPFALPFRPKPEMRTSSFCFGHRSNFERSREGCEVRKFGEAWKSGDRSRRVAMSV
jgi:hypothetical protein